MEMYPTMIINNERGPAILYVSIGSLTSLESVCPMFHPARVKEDIITAFAKLATVTSDLVWKKESQWRLFWIPVAVDGIHVTHKHVRNMENRSMIFKPPIRFWIAMPWDTLMSWRKPAKYTKVKPTALLSKVVGSKSKTLKKYSPKTKELRMANPKRTE